MDSAKIIELLERSIIAQERIAKALEKFTAGAPSGAFKKGGDKKKSDLLTVSGVVVDLVTRGDWTNATIETPNGKKVFVSTKLPEKAEALNVAYGEGREVEIGYKESKSERLDRNNQPYTNRYVEEIVLGGTPTSASRATAPADDDEDVPF